MNRPAHTADALSLPIERQIIVPYSETMRRTVPECLFQLADGRWMLAYNCHYDDVADESPADIKYFLSEDDGATWSGPQLLIDRDDHHNVFAPSLLRLRDGRYALTYYAFDSYECQHMYFRYSDNPFGPWSVPVRVTAAIDGNHGNAGQRLIELRSGRLINPTCYAPTETDERTAVYVAHAWWSDDGGVTWQGGTHDVRIDKRGAMEPVIAQLHDGRLLLFMRNQLGTIYQSVSHDEGETWTDAKPSSLEAPESCCFLTRIESTGDLAAVWNNSRYDPSYDHFGKRCPLTVAISQDDGTSWSQPVHIETDETFTYSMPVAAFNDQWALFAYYRGRGHQSSGQIEAAFARCELSWLYEAAGVPMPAGKESA